MTVVIELMRVLPATQTKNIFFVCCSRFSVPGRAYNCGLMCYSGTLKREQHTKLLVFDRGFDPIRHYAAELRPEEDAPAAHLYFFSGNAALQCGWASAIATVAAVKQPHWGAAFPEISNSQKVVGQAELSAYTTLLPENSGHEKMLPMLSEYDIMYAGERGDNDSAKIVYFLLDFGIVFLV